MAFRPRSGFGRAYFSSAYFGKEVRECETMSDYDYSGSDIVILEGLEAVRKRPGMYIGSTGTRGLHHMIWEILDNGIDEHLAGFCDELHLTLLKDGGVTVEDNGRGVPVDLHPAKKIPTVRVVYTILHAAASSAAAGTRSPAVSTAWAPRWSTPSRRK